MTENEIEAPRTDEGGFAENPAGKFGGGSEAPGFGNADEEYRGEAPGEDDFRREQMAHDQTRREEVAQRGENADQTVVPGHGPVEPVATENADATTGEPIVEEQTIETGDTAPASTVLSGE